MEKIKQSAEFLLEKTGYIPDFILILGSGFSKVGDSLKEQIRIDYQSIPEFRKTSVITHRGEAVFGKLQDKRVMALCGRIHLYEGYSISDVSFPVFVAARMGIKTLVTTNLVGAINSDFKKGDFVIIEDHLNLIWNNPLVGLSEEEFGSRFVDMLDAYSPSLRQRALLAGNELDIQIKTGILGFVMGPNFETRAELRFIKSAGADIVGWSMVPEVIAARHQRMEVLGISCVSDTAYPDAMERVDLENLFETGVTQGEKMFNLLGRIFR